MARLCPEEFGHEYGVFNTPDNRSMLKIEEIETFEGK